MPTHLRRARPAPSRSALLLTAVALVIGLLPALPAAAAPQQAVQGVPRQVARAASTTAAAQAVYGNASGVGVVKAKDDTWRTFGIGANGQIYQQIKHGSWSGPEALGGSFKSAPAVIYRATDHHFDLFAVDTSGLVMQKTFGGGRWSGWISTGVRAFTGALSAVRDRIGNVHLFGIGSGGRVMHVMHVVHHSWGAPEVLGGPIQGNVSVVYQSATHRFDLFVVGNDQRIRQKTYTGTTWLGWRIISKDGFVGGVTAVRINADQWRVLAIGTNRQTYQVAFRVGQWYSPTPLGGSAMGSIASYWSGNSGMVVVTGTDQRLHERTVGAACCSWTALPGAVYPKVTAPPLPAPTRVTLAKTLLSRWGGRLTGLPGVHSDLQTTAAGGAIRNASSCNRSVYLDVRMLAAVVKATGRYRVFVNNMVTGHSCGAGYHPKGKAVDFNTVVDPATGRRTNWHSYESGDDRALDREFLAYTAAGITGGGGAAGQSNCPGSSTAPLPAGMLRFSDYCNHQHLDSR